jgi:hypothetical protein
MAACASCTGKRVISGGWRDVMESEPIAIATAANGSRIILAREERPRPNPASAASIIWKVPLKTSWPVTRSLSSRGPFFNSQAREPLCVDRRKLMLFLARAAAARSTFHIHELTDFGLIPNPYFAA